ncbi:MAG: YbaB/EbfC family nucleoid-associated protein [Bacillota bacterium]
MNFGNMNKMMKQVQQMQAQMAKLQEELGERQVETTVGGGVIQVIANGKMEIVSLKIKPEAVDPEDIEMLEDMVVAAVNEALRKAQEMVNTEMAKITGGIKVPGLF